MLAQKQTGSLVHLCDIEGARFMKREAPPERRHYRSVHDAIDICLSLGRKARMKFVRGLFCFHYAYVTPEVSIDGVLQFFGSKLAVEVDIGYLTLGMHTCIGAPRADNTDFCVRDHADHAFEFTLDSPVVLLHLPTVKIGTVVLYQ